MPTETANYGFTKDNEDEFYNVNTVNANIDKIDTEMKRIEDESKSFNQQVIDNTNAIANANTKLDTHINDIVNHVYFGKDVGNAANSKVITIPVTVPVNYPDGLAVSFRNAVTNTGPVILQVNSRANITVVNSKGAGMVAGDMVAGLIYTVRYNATRSAFQLQGESGVNIGTQSYREFNTPGTHTFTVPEGVTRILAKMWGAGGGGGGAYYTNTYGGGGGGSGGFKEVLLWVRPGQNLTVQVGVGGVGGLGRTDGSASPANNGVAGGTTSIQGAQSQNFYVHAGGGGTGGSSSGGGAGGYGGLFESTGTTGGITSGVPMPWISKSQALTIAYASTLQRSFEGGFGCYSLSYWGGAGGTSPSDCSPGVSNQGSNYGYYAPGEPSLQTYAMWQGGRGGAGNGSTGSGGTSNIAAGSRAGAGGAGGNCNSISTINGGKGADGLVILSW